MYQNYEGFDLNVMYSSVHDNILIQSALNIYV